MSVINQFSRPSFSELFSFIDLSVLESKERMQAVVAKALKVLDQLNKTQTDSIASFSFNGRFGSGGVQVLGVNTPCLLDLDGVQLKTQFAAFSALNYWKNRDDGQVYDFFLHLARMTDSDEIQRLCRSVDSAKKNPYCGNINFEIAKGLLIAKLAACQCPAVLHALLSTGSSRIEYLADFSSFTDTKAVSIWAKDINKPDTRVGNLQGLIWMLMRETAKERVLSCKIENIERQPALPAHPGQHIQQDIVKALASLTLKVKIDISHQPLQVVTHEGLSLLFCKEHCSDYLFWRSIWECDADYIVELCPKHSAKSFCPSVLQEEPLNIQDFTISQSCLAEHYSSSLWQQEEQSCGFFVQNLEVACEGKIKKLRYYLYVGGDSKGLPEMESFISMLGHIQANSDISLDSAAFVCTPKNQFSMLSYAMLGQLRRISHGYSPNVFEELAAFEQKHIEYIEPLEKEHYLFCYSALQRYISPSLSEESSESADVSFSSDSSLSAEEMAITSSSLSM